MDCARRVREALEELDLARNQIIAYREEQKGLARRARTVRRRRRTHRRSAQARAPAPCAASRALPPGRVAACSRNASRAALDALPRTHVRRSSRTSRSTRWACRPLWTTCRCEAGASGWGSGWRCVRGLGTAGVWNVKARGRLSSLWRVWAATCFGAGPAGWGGWVWRASMHRPAAAAASKLTAPLPLRLGACARRRSSTRSRRSPPVCRRPRIQGGARVAPCPPAAARGGRPARPQAVQWPPPGRARVWARVPVHAPQPPVLALPWRRPWGLRRECGGGGGLVE